jgi:uncharacterized protein YkwD
MYSSHNQIRQANGRSSLALDPVLVQVARARAQDMAAKNYFAHTSPSGETAFSLLGGAGYAYTIAGENIARNNYPDSESVEVAMNGFMNSTGHRNNILDARYGRIGVGMAIGAGGMKYFAVVFSN